MPDTSKPGHPLGVACERQWIVQQDYQVDVGLRSRHAAGMRTHQRDSQNRALAQPPLAQVIEKFFHVYSR